MTCGTEEVLTLGPAAKWLGDTSPLASLLIMDKLQLTLLNLRVNGLVEVLNTALILLTKQTAPTYGLSGNIMCCIVEQESNWSPSATRYEPAFYERYIAPLGLPAGEGRDRATSWGLCQVMGETAREMGFTGPCRGMLDPATSLEWGCKDFVRILKQAGSIHAALQRWNGGGNPNYADEVLARMPHYAWPGY